MLLNCDVRGHRRPHAWLRCSIFSSMYFFQWRSFLSCKRIFVWFKSNKRHSNPSISCFCVSHYDWFTHTAQRLVSSLEMLCFSHKLCFNEKNYWLYIKNYHFFEALVVWRHLIYGDFRDLQWWDTYDSIYSKLFFDFLFFALNFCKLFDKFKN